MSISKQTCEIVVQNNDNNNVEINCEKNVESKKSRGRPKLTDEQKKERKEVLKQYQKEYKLQNKDKIANYESLKYDKNNNSERIKKHMKKYNTIINILKFLYFNNLIILGESEKESELKNLLEQCKK